MNRCSIALGLQLLQEGEVLRLRSRGHTEVRGKHLLSKIIRCQAAQLVEVEGGEVLDVVSHELDLGRRGDRIHVGLEGHSLRS
jgi:hypothetical protein